MATLTLVGGQPHRPVRQARRDVYRGGGRVASSPLGFGQAPPLKNRPRGALAAEPTAGPVEKKWVCCHVCSRMFGNPGILNHEVQCFEKWRTRELAKPPSRRLPPPERPELPTGDDAIEAYNKLAQEASDRCRLCPCPKCARTFEPDRLESHARTCQETPDPAAAPPPKHAWGPITRVGDGWELEELERFCRQRRRAYSTAPTYFDGGTSAYKPGIRHSAAVKTDPWDVNGLNKRQLIEKINTNLRRGGAAEAEANDAALWPQQQAFREWLVEVFPDKLKIRQSVFSERLVPR